MIQNEHIEIRDLRSGDWLWVHKAVVFHKSLLSSDKLVYCGLACYANNQSQSSFPSIGLLKNQLGIGKNTLIRSLAKLEKTGLIKIEKNKGKHNVYTLLKVETVKTKNQNAQSQRMSLVKEMGI